MFTDWDERRRLSANEGERANWRRGRDSNPRYGYPYAAFRVRCFQPLSHLSKPLQKIAFQVGGPSWNWAVCYRFATFSKRRFIGSRSTRSTPGPLPILAAAAVTTLECRRLLE